MTTIPFSHCRADGVSLDLNRQNWPEFTYRPSVSVRLRHDGRSLFVRFDVVETHIRAIETEDNHPVCPDSCVECFILCSDGRTYVNLESNPLGTLLGARRIERPVKTPLTDEELALVRRRGSYAGRAPFEFRSDRGSRWWLELEVPFELLGYAEAPESVHLNAYKCGDKTDRPHYLSLYPIDSDRPNFHRPDCFGKLYLERK